MNKLKIIDYVKVVIFGSILFVIYWLNILIF
jgi:hypothetical protein